MRDDRPPRVMRVTFIPSTRRIYRRTLRMVMGLRQSRACSPGCACLICDFCSSGQDFACGFLQIPPRDGHPCRPASGSHHQGPQRIFTSKSLLDHHNQADVACATRALPGAHGAGLDLPLLFFGQVQGRGWEPLFLLHLTNGEGRSTICSSPGNYGNNGT